MPRRGDTATHTPREAAPRLRWPLLYVYGSGAHAQCTEDDLVKEMSADLETNFNKIAPLVKAGLERNAGVHPAAFETGRSRQKALSRSRAREAPAWRTPGCPVSGHDAEVWQAVVPLPDGRAA